MKLSYFNCRGRIEPIRMMLEQKQIPYEFDPVDVSDREEWGKRKAAFAEETPLGQLPILHENGEVICQSLVIARHVAKRAGLDAAHDYKLFVRNQEVVDTAADFMLFTRFLWEPDVHQKIKDKRPEVVQMLTKVQSYFVRVRPDALHWVQQNTVLQADIYMAVALELLEGVYPGILAGEFPELSAFYQHFYAPGTPIGMYVRSDRRPKTWTIAMAPYGGKPEESVQWK